MLPIFDANLGNILLIYILKPFQMHPRSINGLLLTLFIHFATQIFDFTSPFNSNDFEDLCKKLNETEKIERKLKSKEILKQETVAIELMKLQQGTEILPSLENYLFPIQVAVINGQNDIFVKCFKETN